MIYNTRSTTLACSYPSIEFDQDKFGRLDPQRIPKHIAIIPDGNRRWAKKQQRLAIVGHERGSQRVLEIIRAAKALGVKVITFYLFSTENWNRPRYEVSAIMHLLNRFLLDNKQMMLDEGIRLQTIGEITRLPAKSQRIIQEIKEETIHCDSIDFLMALNYGARDEIRRAVVQIVKSGIPAEKITESDIAQHLDTAAWPDPELFIRTSGEERVSNFLLWQLSYAELYITPVLWPDFSPQHLLDALLEYQNRERRMGE